MTFEEALQQLVEEGAIRLWRVSGVWYIAYRVKNGQLRPNGDHFADVAPPKYEARNLNKIGDQWKLGETMVGSDAYHQPGGWYPVKTVHHRAKPIEIEAAEANPGYYMGLTRQCSTCKKYKPEKEFERDMEAEGGFRTWECNQCAAERRAAMAKYDREAGRHLGDYLKRPAHTSRPPVEGEI